MIPRTFSTDHHRVGSAAQQAMGNRNIFDERTKRSLEELLQIGCTLQVRFILHQIAKYLGLADIRGVLS